jgi:hypothetical protein
MRFMPNIVSKRLGIGLLSRPSCEQRKARLSLFARHLRRRGTSMYPGRPSISTAFHPSGVVHRAIGNLLLHTPRPRAGDTRSWCCQPRKMSPDAAPRV